ncbi:MAG: MotA/TolQ/ExbB proton channel family protein, partial [Bacteroidetes bacterium]|nr:MotA/TolQ/ExbB proton channel family protein [Bacteroidota bacterium]
EALITTAFGLIVGIFALAFYNYFLSSVKRLVGDMETVANDVVDTIQDISENKDVAEEELELDI